jgi:hypothetical protein
VAELEQEVVQPVDQRPFQVALGDRAGEVEEVQDVGIPGQLLGELGVGGRQLGGEVRRGGADPGVQPVRDLVEQHVARPSVLDRGGGVPIALALVVEFVQQHGDVAQGQSSNRLLDDRQLRPGGREGAHVEQVAPGQATHAREGGAQVGGEPLDDPGAPALGLLALQDRVPEAPVEPDQLGVDHPLGAPPGGGNGVL